MSNTNKQTIYAIYDLNDNFIAAFPTRDEAENYGKQRGWDGWKYNILKVILECDKKLTESESISQLLLEDDLQNFPP